MEIEQKIIRLLNFIGPQRLDKWLAASAQYPSFGSNGYCVTAADCEPAARRPAMTLSLLTRYFHCLGEARLKALLDAALEILSSVSHSGQDLDMERVGVLVSKFSDAFTQLGAFVDGLEDCERHTLGEFISGVVGKLLPPRANQQLQREQGSRSDIAGTGPAAAKPRHRNGHTDIENKIPAVDGLMQNGIARSWNRASLSQLENPGCGRKMLMSIAVAVNTYNRWIEEIEPPPEEADARVSELLVITEEAVQYIDEWGPGGVEFSLICRELPRIRRELQEHLKICSESQYSHRLLKLGISYD